MDIPPILLQMLYELNFQENHTSLVLYTNTQKALQQLAKLPETDEN